MTVLTLALLAFAVDPWVVPDQPLSPVHSPDNQVLATTAVDQAFVTPEGANYKLLFNGKLIYPEPRKHGFFHAYENQHTFLSPLSWSPDGQHIAFVDKTYDWEYEEPYNRYFNGRVTKLHFYLAIVDRAGRAETYSLDSLKPGSNRNLQDNEVHWLTADRVDVNGRVFNLKQQPEKSLP